MKKCTKCLVLKPLVYFSPRKDTACSYASQCRACKRAHDNAYAATSVAKEIRAKYSFKHRNLPEVKSKDKQQKAIYHQLPRVKEAKKLSQRLRRLTPEVQVKERFWGAEYAKANPDKMAAKTRKRKAAKLQRFPAWLNAGELFEMECVYKYCAALRIIGLDYQVDHIVPLQGRMVSGLHLPWNLQLLTASENAAKGNRMVVG